MWIPPWWFRPLISSSNFRDSLAIINKIWKLIDKHEEVVMVHSIKETDNCVDALAKVGYRIS